MEQQRFDLTSQKQEEKTSGPVTCLGLTFDNAEVVHLRPSGNAPEFRCYAEAGTAARATDLCARVLAILPRLG